MPVQFVKMQHREATAQRVTEAQTAIVDMFRALAPAVQRCGEEMGRSFEQLREQVRAQRP